MSVENIQQGKYVVFRDSKDNVVKVKNVKTGVVDFPTTSDTSGIAYAIANDTSGEGVFIAGDFSGGARLIAGYAQTFSGALIAQSGVFGWLAATSGIHMAATSGLSGQLRMDLSPINFKRIQMFEGDPASGEGGNAIHITSVLASGGPALVAIYPNFSGAGANVAPGSTIAGSYVFATDYGADLPNYEVFQTQVVKMSGSIGVSGARYDLVSFAQSGGSLHAIHLGIQGQNKMVFFTDGTATLGSMPLFGVVFGSGTTVNFNEGVATNLAALRGSDTAGLTFRANANASAATPRSTTFQWLDTVNDIFLSALAIDGSGNININASGGGARFLSPAVTMYAKYPEYNVVVYKAKDAIIAANSSGAVISSGVSGTFADEITVINAAKNAVPNGGVMLFAPNETYYYGLSGVATASREIIISGDMNIWGYGATLKVPASGINRANKLINLGSGRSLSIYGMKIDAQYSYAGVVSADLNNTPKLLRLIDVEINNIYDYGVTNGGNNSGVSGYDTTVYIDNIKVDAGGVDAVDECIFTRAVNRLTLRNAVLANTKPFYLTGENLDIENVVATASGYTDNHQLPVNGENVMVKDMLCVGCSPSFRPYGAGDLQVPFASAKRIEVDGYTCKQITTDIRNFEIEAFDETVSGRIENITLQNIYLDRGGIFIQPHANSPSGQATISNMTIRDIKINAFDANEVILFVENMRIDRLTIDGAVTPTYAGGTTAPLRLVVSSGQNNAATPAMSGCSVGLCTITNISPMAGTGRNIVRTNANNLSGQNIAVTFTRPLDNGANGTSLNNMSGVGMATRFYHNASIFLGSGDTSNTGYFIPHSLAQNAASGAIIVVPGSVQARGDFDVSGNSSGISIRYATAPASGDVRLYWSVGI